MSRIKNKIESITEGREKVYIIPTRSGLKFIFINFTLFLISLSYANNMALLITFIMVSYFILQMLDTHKLIQETKLDSIILNDDFLNANNETICHFKNTISNNHNKKLQIELIGERNIKIKAAKSNFHDEHIIKYPLRLKSRGHFKISSIKLFTFGDSGLFYVWRYFKTNKEFFVYPEKQKNNSTTQSTTELINNISSESEFLHHIPYRHGLNSKRIDWKIYARKDQLYWKKHIDFLPNSLEINFNLIEGDTEEKLKKMSYLIDHTFKHGDSWSLVLPSKVIKNASGMKHYKESLEAISEF